MVLSFPVAGLAAEEYSASSDAWSYGIVMFEIWSFGCRPFEDKTAVEVSHVIAESIVKATSIAYWFVRNSQFAVDDFIII